MNEVEILNDDELRYALIQLFQMPTARTLQDRIGASDLCDQCDRCLSMKMRGIKRTSPRAERPWFGREWGTAAHGLIENRINQVTEWESHPELTIAEKQRFAASMRASFGMPTGVRSERRLKIADIPGYGEVFGTIDIDLPGQIVDLKGSTRKKSALLQDFLAIQRGLPERRWERQKDTKAYSGGYKLKLGSDQYAQLSHAKYEEEMAKGVYKMSGYYGQQNLYLHGRALEGRPAVRGTIAWMNRDGNGYFDEPGASGYDDPMKHRDIWMLSFDYNADYAQALINRGAAIFAKLEAGAVFVDFESHERCYACGFEAKDEAPIVELVPAIDVELAIADIAA